MPRSQKPRKRHNIRKTARQPLHKPPHIWQVWRTFEPIYRLLDLLRGGEIDAVAGQPVMVDWGGDLIEVAPALEGWASCWQRIIGGEGLSIDLAPLRQMQRYLANGELLTVDLIDQVTAITDQCYQAYARMPRERAISYSKTEQIAIEMDDLCIEREAA